MVGINYKNAGNRKKRNKRTKRITRTRTKRTRGAKGKKVLKGTIGKKKTKRTNRINRVYKKKMNKKSHNRFKKYKNQSGGEVETYFEKANQLAYVYLGGHEQFKEFLMLRFEAESSDQTKLENYEGQLETYMGSGYSSYNNYLNYFRIKHRGNKKYYEEAVDNLANTIQNKIKCWEEFKQLYAINSNPDGEDIRSMAAAYGSCTPEFLGKLFKERAARLAAAEEQATGSEDLSEKTGFFFSDMFKRLLKAGEYSQGQAPGSEDLSEEPGFEARMMEAEAAAAEAGASAGARGPITEAEDPGAADVDDEDKKFEEMLLKASRGEDINIDVG